MSGREFFKGAAVGMVIGSAVGMFMVPDKKMCSKKRTVGRAIRAVGEVVENFSDFIGI